MFRHITRNGIIIEEVDRAINAGDKTVFNIKNIPHDSTRPESILVKINSRDFNFKPENGWAQVAFEVQHGPNRVVFRNLDSRPIVYTALVSKKIVRDHKDGNRLKILEWNKRHGRGN